MTSASCYKDLVERFIGFWNLGKRAVETGHWASADDPEQLSKFANLRSIDDGPNDLLALFQILFSMLVILMLDLGEGILSIWFRIT
jgi:hypothetical protein